LSRSGFAPESMAVSVIIPTRNRSNLLAMTLRSVLRQEDVDLEVIVVDEASTDDTPVVLAAVGDTRVRVIRHDTPQGLSSARNHGAAVACGDWLAFLDDDDLWAPDKLVRQLDAAQEASRDWVYTGSVNIDGCRIVYSRPPLRPEQVVAALPRYNAIPGGGSNVVVRRATWLRAGPFDTRLRHGGEDWEMSIRLAEHGPPAWVCSPLIAKRVHSSNMFLDIAEIVHAIRVIEALHNTQADWGRMHRWLAERYLRSGQRRAALGQFARAAVRGQLRGVVSDLGAILRRRVGRRIRKPDAQSALSGDAWSATAAAWLREFDPCVR
jgi:glycosyltransferase involved in cell wall biosynthesis